MKTIHIPFLAAAIGLTVFASCQKELMTPITGDNTAVVESYLKAGDTSLTVYISKIIPYSDDTVDAKVMIPGIDVYINGERLTETDTGVYVLRLANQKVTGGTTYNLQFEYSGKTVSSQTVIPQAPADFTASASTIYVERVTEGSSGPPSMMDPVTLSWSNPDASYYYLMVNYLEKTPDYINSNISHSGFEFVQGATPTQESTYQLDRRVINCFGTYQLVLFKVNREFNDVFTKNGTNSNNLVNPITNITNGFGVFTGMNSDTLHLEVKPY